MRVVVDAVFDDDEPVALTELVDLTGLSRPTLTQTLRLMTAFGLVEQRSGRPASGIGRPLSVYHPLRSHHEYCVVVIAYSWFDIAIADAFGQIVMAERTDIREGESLASQVAEHVDHMVGAREPGTMAVIIAVMGIVHEGKIVNSSRHPELAEPGVLDAMGGPVTTRWPNAGVMVGNDAKLAARWMYRQAVASGVEASLVLAVHMNVAVGCGIVIHGEILDGAHGAAGEIYLEVDNKFHEAERRLWEAVDRLGRSWKSCFTDAGAGDHEAVAAAAEIARCVADGLRPIVLALDPDTILIGGPLANAGENLRQIFEREIGEVSLTAPRVILSPHSEAAVRDGALMVAIDRMRDRLVEQLGEGRKLV